MFQAAKNFLSNYPSIYNLIKRLKNNLSENKIFYQIKSSEIKNFNLDNSSYQRFNKKNLNKLFQNKESLYIFITDKNLINNYSKDRLKSLLEILINNKDVDIIYDGSCSFYTEICTSRILEEYSKEYNIEDYPKNFFYFYQKLKLNIKNIGINHRVYNFNGTFILPEGGKTIGDGGDVNFRLNFIPDLTNKTFLDIGAEEGYSVFNALTKNAIFAKGLNIREDKEYDLFPEYSRLGSPTPRKRTDIEKTINFLKKIYNLENSKKISFEYKNIYNLKNEMYDFVFCFGVLYHLKNPYLAIENLFKATNDTLILETQGSFSTGLKYSALLDEDDGFVRHSPGSLKFLLLKAGFKKVEIIFSGVNKVKKISNIVLKAKKNR